MAEDDVELRDLVAHTLEVNGVLNKIRAELRANVFLALEEQDASVETNRSNKPLADFLETKHGHQVFALVREFLQFFNLDFTLAVLEPESNCGAGNLPTSREDLKNELELTKCDASHPLLVEFMHRSNNATSPSSFTPKKSNSKIPRPTKSPTNSKSEEHLSDKRVLISPDDDDEELLKELGVSPLSFSVLSKEKGKKASWLDDIQPPNVALDHSAKKTPPVSPPDLGSLRGAPPLPGLPITHSPKSPAQRSTPPKSPSADTSLNWDDFLKMDDKLSALGFEMPAEEEEEEEVVGSKETRYSYEDDFLSLERSEEEKLSVTEEIESEVSLGSFAGSRAEEDVLVTTDETISHIAAAGFDYGEDAIF